MAAATSRFSASGSSSNVAITFSAGVPIFSSTAAIEPQPRQIINPDRFAAPTFSHETEPVHPKSKAACRSWSSGSVTRLTDNFRRTFTATRLARSDRLLRTQATNAPIRASAAALEPTAVQNVIQSTLGIGHYSLSHSSSHFCSDFSSFLGSTGAVKSGNGPSGDQRGVVEDLSPRVS